jgi:hypothetical protein
MQHQAMARERATDVLRRGIGSLPARQRDVRSPSATAGESFSRAATRSVLGCTALAAGIAGIIVAMSGEVDAIRPVHAATLTTMPPLPKPRVKLVPELPEDPYAAFPDYRPSEDIVTGGAESANARTDRVPLDYLLPEATAPGVGNPDDVLIFGPMRIRRHLVDTILKAAKATEADPVLLMAIADKESSFATEVQARTSSATGLFQFIEKTWLKVVRDFGRKHGLEKEAQAVVLVDDEFVVLDPAERARILELRRDPYLSALLAAEMLKRDAARIAQRIGRNLNRGEVYLAHFLGPDDAERFMEKVVDEPNFVAANLLPKPAKANKPIFYTRVGRKKTKGLSVAEVHRKFESMMDLRLDRYRDVHQVAAVTAMADTPAQ